MHAAAAVPEVLEKSGRHLHNTGRGPFRSQAKFYYFFSRDEYFFEGLKVFIQFFLVMH
jgi:hypothetical protein